MYFLIVFSYFLNGHGLTWFYFAYIVVGVSPSNFGRW